MTALHRPAVKQRRFRHDSTVAVDLFAGFGGLSTAAQLAGFDVIMAANHNEYKVRVHEANHPEAEHWIADLVDTESGDYHSARDLPKADLLLAGVSCVNHSLANTKRAYRHSLSLFDLDDPDYEAQVTRSERDRATATCVLQYAGLHHPKLILVECTTQLQSWGNLVPGSRKIGDGTTYRWWLKQLKLLGYKHRLLFLNSMFFGVGQSRDRGYWVFWDKHLPDPDLDHRPAAWCTRCDRIVEAVWTWKTGIPQSGTVQYGKQYCYRCPSCHTVVQPEFTPSLDALDLTDLGQRIGDKPLKPFRDKITGETIMSPLAPATMARAERCRQRFAEFPAVLMPAKAVHGSEKHPWQPMATQTSQQETAILSTGAIMAAAGNTYEHPGSDCRSRDLSQPLPAQTATPSQGLLTPPVALGITNFQGAARSAGEALPTQGGSETLGILSSGVVPFRQHTTPATHAEPMPTATADQIPGLITAAGWIKNNGTTGTETAPHPITDPFGAFVGRTNTSILTAHAWQHALAELSLLDCYFRMMTARETGRGCGFDVDWNGRKGSFIVWGSARDQVDGYGNAVTPGVGEWIGLRLRAILHGKGIAA